MSTCVILWDNASFQFGLIQKRNRINAIFGSKLYGHPLAEIAEQQDGNYEHIWKSKNRKIETM